MNTEVLRNNGNSELVKKQNGFNCVHIFILFMHHILKVYKYSKMFTTLMDSDTVFKTNNTVLMNQLQYSKQVHKITSCMYYTLNVLGNINEDLRKAYLNHSRNLLAFSLMRILLTSNFLINRLPTIHNVVCIIFRAAKICIRKAQMTVTIWTYRSVHYVAQ